MLLGLGFVVGGRREEEEREGEAGGRAGGWVGGVCGACGAWCVARGEVYDVLLALSYSSFLSSLLFSSFERP